MQQLYYYDCTFQKIISVENNNQPHNLLNKLAIQCSLEEFSFTILDSQTNEILSFENYPFETKIENPTALQSCIKNIFSLEPLLQQDYSEIILLHQNEWSTIVPDVYFDEKLLKDYLKYSIKVFDNDFIAYDELPIISAKNVYIPFVNINNFIFENFGEFTYLHTSSVFLKNILTESTSEENTMHVHFFKSTIHIVVNQQNKLILSNHFNYQTKEDIAYYILFVAEQLKMDNNVFSLTLYGNISEESDAYQLLYQYVRNIQISNQNQSIIFSHIKNLFS